MGSSKPKPVAAPFEQKQQTTNTYGRFGLLDTQEAQDLQNVPLDFGQGGYGGLSTDVSVDPGVGRRTDLAEQEVENRYGSALNFGVPSFIRDANRARELRDVRSRGAAERQQAEYAQQMGQRDLEFKKAELMGGAAGQRTAAELARRERLLPQYFQTGGSGSTSGFNTVVTQPQPGFWQRLALTAAQGAASNLKFGGAG